MTAYPLVFIGRSSYSFQKPASGQQVLAALRLVSRVKKSDSLVTIAVSLKG